MEQLIIQTKPQLKQAYILLEAELDKGAIDILYRSHKKDKSKEQLAYYYGFVLPIIKKRVEQDGNKYSIDDIDGFCKSKFFSYNVFNPLTQQTEKIIRQKRNATISEMSEFLSQVIQFAEESLGLQIPNCETYKILREIGVK